MNNEPSIYSTIIFKIVFTIPVTIVFNTFKKKQRIKTIILHYHRIVKIQTWCKAN